MAPRRPSGPVRAGRTRSPEQGEQVEGRQAVRELLRARRRRVHDVLVSEDAVRVAILAEIEQLALESGVPLRTVTGERIDALAAGESAQGVIARADPLPTVTLEELVRPNGQRPFLVVLEGVTDPRNLGAVARSAACAGATGLVMARHRSAGLTPVALKAAAGAFEHLRVATVPGIPAALSALSSSGVWTVALDPAADASLWTLPVSDQPLALVLGAEGAGLSRLARNRCELAVAIPAGGPLASLNVAAAAAVGCFEVARRRALPD